MKRFKLTRIAPTPSGYLHIGNLYSFLLTQALARKYQANIHLRIDDMDSERVRDSFLQDIFTSLEYMGIRWHSGPADLSEVNRYSQTRKLKEYDDVLQSLRNKSKVFACNCSRSKIQDLTSDPCSCIHKNISLDHAEVCWRLNTEENYSLTIFGIDDAHKTDTLPEQMRNFIVRKKDKKPAYQLCSVVDDLLLGVDLIVRGEDLYESTLAQLYLAHAAGLNKFQKISFVHHALIRNARGEKLSKSAGDISIQHLRTQGASPLQIIEQICGLLDKTDEQEFRKLLL